MDTGIKALRDAACIYDFSSRGSLVLLGEDRTRFLQGQTTQDISSLDAWDGAYTTYVTNKGRMVSDGFAFILPDEILLDLEESTQQQIFDRFDHHIVADDVEVVDAGDHYHHFGFFGPKAKQLITLFDSQVEALDFKVPNSIHKIENPSFGEMYLTNPDRGLGPEIDVYIPIDQGNEFKVTIEKLAAAAGLGPVASLTQKEMEQWRILSGVPKFGVDLNEKNLPPEGGLEVKGISYQKGCYIGQEVLNRLRAMGQVTKKLVCIQFQTTPSSSHGEIKLFSEGKEVGRVTSIARASQPDKSIGLAMLKKGLWDSGQILDWQIEGGAETGQLEVAEAPFENHIEDISD